MRRSRAITVEIRISDFVSGEMLAVKLDGYGSRARALALIKKAAHDLEAGLSLDVWQQDHAPGPLSAAVEMGRRAGRVGGKVRAARLSPEQRSESARRAALARWARRRS